jgi:glycosyltransferase involved in cell wall biosynthesis
MSPGESRFEDYYICAVGALTPRKNLITLLKAWNLWLEKHPERRGFLLNIAGNAHFKDPIFESAMGELKHLDTVKWLGRLEDDALEQLYRGAIAFCMPSAMEGFGIPVVEAMQCGTPVMASNNSALTEVVGDAGMLLPTFDVEAWADGLEAMARGSEKKDGASEATGEGGENLSAKGLIRGGQFTWSASAAPWLEVLTSASE